MKNINVNQLKDVVMRNYRFCDKVYNTGFERYEQFESFIKLCENHVDYCNYWCSKLKPIIPFLQLKKFKKYKDFRYACAYTINLIKDKIDEYNESYKKQVEESELLSQIETRARIEHEINLEYRDFDTKSQLDSIRNKKIGFLNKNNDNDEQKNINDNNN